MGAVGLRTSIARARQLALRDWFDLAVATSELAIARVRLDRSSVEDHLKEQAPEGQLREGDAERIERVRIAIRRAHHRVPWRSDCLVQALAAYRWLGRYGIWATVWVGVPETKQDPFEAHAWLTCGGQAVTGGSVGGHIPLKAVRTGDC